jgi:hypothetical protein
LEEQQEWPYWEREREPGWPSYLMQQGQEQEQERQQEETVPVIMMVSPLELTEQSHEAFGISGSDHWHRL